MFQPRAEPLIRALHAYVCWRIAAGAVGWAWLLLGLATDRLGATNAVALAIHVTAVSTARECIFYCSVAAFCLRHQSWLGAETPHGRVPPVFPTVPCVSGGVLLACRNADLGAGASWTLAASSRGERGRPPAIWPGRCLCGQVLSTMTGVACGTMPHGEADRGPISSTSRASAPFCLAARNRARISTRSTCWSAQSSHSKRSNSSRDDAPPFALRNALKQPPVGSQPSRRAAP